MQTPVFLQMTNQHQRRGQQQLDWSLKKPARKWQLHHTVYPYARRTLKGSASVGGITPLPRPPSYLHVITSATEAPAMERANGT